MNKQLLASTALVAAGVLMTASQASAAGKTVKLGLHGYMEQVVGFAFDRSDAEATDAAANSVTSLVQHTEAEIHFKGSGKLDNGITIIADVQLEVTGSPGNIIDEQYVIVRGGFGQLNLGSEDNAASLMTLGYSGSWATGVGRNNNLHVPNYFADPAAMSTSPAYVAIMAFEGDSSKITYFTPRFSGVQVGVSYIPNFRQMTTARGGGKSTKAGGSGGYHEGLAIGINYTGKFDGGAIGVAGGFLTAISDGVNGTASATTYKDTDDMSVWKVAAKIDVGPLRIAAGMVVSDGVHTTTISKDGTMYDVGAKYTMGPNAFSVTYAHGELEANKGNGDEEESHFIASYRRTLGAGVSWSANIMQIDVKDDVAAGTANAETSGWAVATSLKLVF